MKAIYSVCLLGFALPSLLPTASAEEGRAERPKLDDFLRFVEDDESGRLETSVVTYRNADGAEVELVGAVHIADAEYYAELSKLFAGYEALLFEMVGGRDGLKKEDLQGTGGIRMLQGIMGRTLELDFQLDGIDYTAENFVHADMDAATFSRRLKKQGVNLFALMNKVSKWEEERAKERKKKGIPEPEMGMLAVVQALIFGGGKDLKLELGRQFGDLNSFMAELDEEGAVIIGERNAVALEVLEKTLKEGKKNIGIFYGAAHLPDMEVRLKAMGFTRAGVVWKTAWFVPKKEGVKRGAEGEGGEDSKGEAKGSEESGDKEPGAKGEAAEEKLGGERQGRHRKIRKAA